MSFICGGKSSSCIMELHSNMKGLAGQMKQLMLLNNTVRSELRRHRGHNGKVNNKVLVWLDHVDRSEKQCSEIWYRYLSLSGLVNFIQVSPSSVLIFFASSEVFEESRFSWFFPRDFVRYNYDGDEPFLLFHKIKEKIWEYLDDPFITTISFYGGEGWVDHKITRQITMENFIHKIVRVKLFDMMSLKHLKRHMRKNREAEVNKCLLIFDFDYEYILKPGSLNNINRQILNLGYSRRSVFKMNKQIVSLSNEVKALARSNASLQLIYDEDGAHRVPRKFTPRQTVTGQLTREVSSNIWEYLLDPMIGTIGLYGVGGVGKTTIIKNICIELGNTDIFDSIIWVSLSRTKVYLDYPELHRGHETREDPEDYYKRLQDEIAMQLELKLLGNEKVEQRASTISEKLKIMGKCLFILDDVGEIVQLSTFGIPYPERDNGCKVVLTTRYRDACSHLSDAYMSRTVQKTMHLLPLSEKEAWELFVSKSGDQVLNPEIESIAKKIVYECGGLPITIITVSHAMQDKVHITAWEFALGELQSNHSQIYGKGMDHLFDVLLFCINHLKNDQVRLCFLCCAIFPEDYKFDSMDIIRYWIAENLIHNKGGMVESIKDGCEILKELKDASMLDTFMEGGIEWLRMNDLFRDLAIIMIRMELDFLVRAGTGLRNFPITLNAKMSLIRNSIVNLPETRRTLFIKLSTLLLRENPLSHIPFSFFSSMHNLQVLDMSYSALNQLPPSFSKLHTLRVLFLDFCTGMEQLPSLEKLKYLQFLSLRGTLMKELPRGIEKLVNLISLDLSETIRLKHIKAGVISSLSKLEELQLQGSRLCKMESMEGGNLFKEIRCLKQLGILTLSAIGFGDHLDTILHLQQHNLKIFTVNAYGSALDYMEDE